MRQTDREFEKKTVLITGGTKGLGLSIARLFALEKANIVLAYRNDDDAALLAQKAIYSMGVECEIIKADLAEEGSVDQLFDTVSGYHSSIDCYVHNAAATAFKDLLELKSHHIDKTMNITVKGFILGVQRATQLMSRGGAIVAISGMDTLKAVPRHGLLGAAKAALETLTAYYAHELASRQIRVNAVNPGFLSTDSTRKYLGPAFETVARQFADATPLKREPSLEEIAEAVLFLCSRRSSWIVGQTLCVDGGLDFSLQNAVAGKA